MTTVLRFAKAASLDEALAAKRADPSAVYLAGGTLLLAGDGRAKPVSLIDLGSALPRDIERREDARSGDSLCLGAGLTFQEMAESKALPSCLVEAALSMVNRNTRNRATLGGNLAADKSCSSLLPILLALDAEIELITPSSRAPERVGLEAWLGARAKGHASDLILRAFVPLRAGARAAYRRWNRSACDLSVLGAAAAFGFEGSRVRALRLALGGLGPKARRFPEIEALFEGSPLPSRESIERAVAPLLEPIDDLRASAAFKRLRGAQLVADALLGASALIGASALLSASALAGTEARP